MHFITKANIQSCSESVPSGFLFGGGWNATLRPGFNGSWGDKASLRAFGSFENLAGGGIDPREGALASGVPRFDAPFIPDITDVAGEASRGLLRLPSQAVSPVRNEGLLGH
jgi:hypothetical protein